MEATPLRLLVSAPRLVSACPRPGPRPVRRYILCSHHVNLSLVYAEVERDVAFSFSFRG